MGRPSPAAAAAGDKPPRSGRVLGTGARARFLLLERRHGSGLGPRDALREGTVEAAQHLDPLQPAAGDVVQRVFHLSGKGQIDDAREVHREEVVGSGAQFRGDKVALLEVDVPAVLDGGDDGGIRRWPADAGILQRLDERCLGKAAGRLGEVLRRQHVLEIERLPSLKRGQPVIGRCIVGCRLAGGCRLVLVRCQPAGEDERGGLGLEREVTMNTPHS
jgi:hypothetical protein